LKQNSRNRNEKIFISCPENMEIEIRKKDERTKQYQDRFLEIKIEILSFFKKKQFHATIVTFILI
jgi:hypothetical protein